MPQQQAMKKLTADKCSPARPRGDQRESDFHHFLTSVVIQPIAQHQVSSYQKQVVKENEQLKKANEELKGQIDDMRRNYHKDLNT